MQVGIVLVAFSGYPRLAFDSIVGKTIHQITWFVHCHSANEALERQLIDFCIGQKCDLRLHRHNRGLSRSWNDGIIASYEANNDLTIVMNDDIAFRPGALDRFISYLARTPPFALAFLHGAELDSNATDKPAKIVQQEFACFAFGQLAFDEIGALDENIFPAYVEDTDYMARVRNVGVPLVIDPRVHVDHARSNSAKALPHLQTAIESAWQANLEYYRTKWGATPDGQPYDEAFNARGNFIAWADRRAPYGAGLDRADLPADGAPHLRLCSFPADVSAASAPPQILPPFAPMQLPIDGDRRPTIVAHIALLGDETVDKDGWAGLRGSGRAIEGFAILLGDDIPPAGYTYQAVLGDAALTEAVEAGEFCGTRGESTPLFGLRIDIYEDFVPGFDVIYEAQFTDGTRAGPVLAPIVCRSQSGAPLEAFRVTLAAIPELLESYEV